MNLFDTLQWIRQVRDRRHGKERGLSDKEKLAATKAGADDFRSSRPQETAASRTTERHSQT